jgi:serine/threonine-protein phosphatase 6 regulatory ankyrin repeat subunit B
MNDSTTLQRFADAIVAGDLPTVEALLAAGADANARLPGYQSPLTLAAAHGHDAILRACIRQGADVLARGSEFCSQPLVVAVANARHECVQTLLAVGAGSHRESLDEALMAAAELGNTALVVQLCAEGADPYQVQRKGHSPLSRAIAAAHFATAHTILSFLADPAKRRTHLKNALRFFVWGCSLGGARFVLAQAPDIYDEPDDYTGESPLEGAAARGHAGLLKLLLARGPCKLEGPSTLPRPWPSGSETPLMAAVWVGSFEAVKVLVDAGASVAARSPASGYTPLMFACGERRSLRGAEIVSYLVTHGAELEARSNDGFTALLLAAKTGSPQVLEALLRLGADVGARDSKGWDVFALAEKRADHEIVALLTKHLE